MERGLERFHAKKRAMGRRLKGLKKRLQKSPGGKPRKKEAPENRVRRREKEKITRPFGNQSYGVYRKPKGRNGGRKPPEA